VQQRTHLYDPLSESDSLESEQVDADVEADLLAVERRQALRDGQLVAVRRDGVLCVPAEFLTDDGAIVKGLPGTITVLADAGFSPDEMIRWLFTADESLPGRPVDALRATGAREVKRRAQALAL